MLQKIREAIAEERSDFYDGFKNYVETLLELGEITQEEYNKIETSLQSKNFENVMTTCGTVEAINRWCMRYLSLLLTGAVVAKFPNKALEIIVISIVCDRIVKFLYTMPIAKHFQIERHILFSCINSIPFGKFVTPCMWLRNDFSTVKNLVQYNKDKLQLILMNPYIQGISRLV